ncbi:bystin-like [Styela clava]
MGKSKKVKAKRAEPLAVKQSVGLVEDITADNVTKAASNRQPKVRFRQEEDDFVDNRLTKKILDAAVKQQKELEGEVGIGASKFKTVIKLGKKSNSDSENEDEDEWPSLAESAALAASGEYQDQDIVINQEDEKALQAFMNPDPPTRRTLADIIMEKITEKKTDVSTLMPDVENPMPDIDPRIIEVYKDVKSILIRYRSGKLPKAFKVLPHLKNWEEILYITEPDTWSAAALYQATRIFASNLNVHMAQRFFNLVLLPRIRDDIHYYKRLNFHLFMALKKALYKPAAFFKGIILPLCEEGTCTLREATIISSVITKCTIPVLHASAAMIKIAEMHYSGGNSIFLRALITKKYALPFRVIDALVFHFSQFRNDKRELPVLWHQCLLSFVETYRNDVSDEQADSLRELLRYQIHPKITPEIRQQLMSRESKEIIMEEPE